MEHISQSNEVRIFVFLMQYKKWTEIDFKQLRIMDMFKIIEVNGDRHSDENTGDNVWIAAGDPYIDSKGIWTVRTLN